MMIFFYGSDGYRIGEAVNAAVKRYAVRYPEGDVTAIDMTAPEAAESLRQSLEIVSLFRQPRCIVINRGFAAKATGDVTFERLEQASALNQKEVICIIAAPQTAPELKKKHSRLFALCMQSSTIKEYPALAGAALVGWVKDECAKRGAVLTPPALSTLIQRAGTDMWLLTQEIEKVCNYARTEAITPADVARLVAPQEDTSIFELTDAIAGRAPMAVAKLYRELAGAGEPYGLIGLLASQFRNLIMIKDLAGRGLTPGDIATKTGLHPFVIRKALASIGRFSAEELRGALHTLAHLEADAKDGRADPEAGLYGFVLEMSRS